MIRIIKILASLSTLVVLCSCNGSVERDETIAEPLLERKVLRSSDLNGAPWAKFPADVLGDASPELLVAFHGSKELIAFSSGDVSSQVLIQNYAFLTDGEVYDINLDGFVDLILPTEQGLAVFYGPDWRSDIILNKRFHDVEVDDLDSDGQPEIVARNQTAFSDGRGDISILSRSAHQNEWVESVVELAEGEGLELADVDGDGDTDIVANAVWFENDTDGNWEGYRYAESWEWPHVKIAVADLDGDDRLDIVLSPSEPEGEQYRISWFQLQDDARDYWREKVLIDRVETVVHSLQAGDVDQDGDTDLVFANMHQGDDPDEIVFLENIDKGDYWRRRTIDEGGSHNIQLFDFDLDGDLDLAGANWSGAEQAVLLWENRYCDTPWSAWERHIVDDKRPGRATFIFSADLNADSFPDLTAGAFFYTNPARAGNEWRAQHLGKHVEDIVFVSDFDKDGAPDLLAVTEEASGGEFVLFKNDGYGHFRRSEPVAKKSGDFLQGVSLNRFQDGRNSLAMSWHRSGVGVELLHVGEVDQMSWELERISEYSQDEALSSGDIDDDGDIDLLLGTSWLSNDGSGWTKQTIDSTTQPPDRNILVDIDGDGDLDAVVGFEAISVPGDLVWYEATNNTSHRWMRHHIARIVGPMSLDVADIDGDGDFDVISGEHNLIRPDRAALWIFENADGRGTQWRNHQIHIGDEHHDGTQALDVDLDGDLDIVSIGWGHNQVIWYENRMPACARTR